MKWLIFLATNVVVRSFTNSKKSKNRVRNLENGAMYDFIIVGAGSTGCVIANRLSENANWNVLLLEAGEKEDVISRVPMLLSLLYFSRYNWHYTMEPQNDMGWALEEQRMALAKGKGLGGSSIINYMIYSRGNPMDYDRWASLGNEGWSYEDVLPYFIKSENASLANADYRYHGTTGYQSVQDSFQSPIASAFLEGAKELGHRLVDYNSADQFGFSTMQGTTRNGRRHTAARAFLEPAEERDNLNILTSAHVTKIIINETTMEAQGVQYVHDGQTYTAYASKEVIISAGSLHSPQLLMLSGIGPKEDLEELEIPVLRDLPVGKHLQDHTFYPGLVFTVDETAVITPKDLISVSNILSYILEGQGPYSSTAGGEGMGFIKTNVSTEEGEYPDIELIMAALSLNIDCGLTFRRYFRISQEYYDKYWAPYNFLPTFGIFVVLLHPKSVGFLKLRSTDPFQPPLFYGNYFSDPQGSDLATMIAGIRYAVKLTKTTAFEKFGTKISPIPVPGCEQHPDDSDLYWECAVRTFAVSIFHHIGTAKMGPEDDPYAVVDDQLRVYGMQKLRVADCSVTPLPLAAHMNAPALMIGEKASDLIKSTWNGVK